MPSAGMGTEQLPSVRSAHRRAKALIVAATVALALTAVVTLSYSAFDEPAATPRCAFRHALPLSSKVFAMK